MIYLTLYNKLWIRIETTELKALEQIKENFSYFVDGYFFMKKYRSGVWDGKIHVFDYKNRLLPYGLLFDLIKLLKKNRYEVKVSSEVKSLFGNGNDINMSCNLKFDPRYYQNEIIKECIRYKKGLFISPTASGKSFCITCIIDILQKNSLIDRSLIIVPTTNLIEQFYSDMLDYGIDENLLGRFYADAKDWDKPVLISTWQSLSYNNEKIRKNEVLKLRKEIKKKTISEEERETYKDRLNVINSVDYKKRVQELMEYRINLLQEIDCVIVDECQGAKSTEVLELMKKTSNAEYRFGCTGTIPDSKLDIANIKSFIGPIIRRYSVRELTDAGFLNNCSIEIYNLCYEDKITGKINEVKEQLFNNQFRKNVIYDVVEKNEGENILILVGLVEKEGKVLERDLKERFPDKQVKFIHGKIKTKEREEWRQKCIKENNVILIAIYQLFQQGINIPNLSCIILGSSYKAKIRTLQSIGRALRKPDGKKKSKIIDLVDHSNKFLPKHAQERMKFYEKEEFEINEIDLYESEWRKNIWDMLENQQ